MFDSFSFTHKYLIAFLIVSILASIAFLTSKKLISQQYIDAKIINVAGQQRMLSQKIVLHVLQFDEKKLRENIINMYANHKFLSSQDMNKDVSEMFYSNNGLENKLKRYIDNANQYIKIQNQVNLDYIVEHSENLLGCLDNAVSLYQSGSESKIKYLERIELALFIIILVVMALEIKYIFIPANRKIVNYAKQLKDDNRKLSLEVASRSQEIIEKHVISSKTDVDARITYVSKAFENLSGYKYDELLGKSHNILRHPDMKREDYQNLWMTIISGKTWQGELKNRKKNGDVYWVNCIVEPMLKDGAIVGYTSIKEDITAKKELDKVNKSLNESISLAVAELENKNKLMLQQSRLAQMGEMISMIAHQWRQPLASIASVATNLSMRTQLDNYEEKYYLEKLNDISDYTQHLSSTINDFKNFFQPTNEVKEIEYKQVIDESLNIIESSLNDRKIKIIKKIQSCQKHLTYDNELKQVLINLISNSRDALIENSIVNPEIIVETLMVADVEVLRISDNGGGIADDIIEKIFDPYFSTKMEKNGTGLGLYMSKTIIEEHCRGSLIVYNSSVGAVFEIRV